MISSVGSFRALPTARPARPAVSEPEFYDTFLKQSVAEGANADHLSFLDRGIDSSFLKGEIPSFPSRLHALKPSAGRALPFPSVGQKPPIENGLDFLHPSIDEACLCLGHWQDGQLQARWLGRNATTPVQMWSATKTWPMARVAVRAKAPLENLRIAGSTKLTDAFDQIVSYRQGGSASNRQARTLKQFETPVGLESWVKGVTGNQSLTFRGGYGEPPTVARPTLLDEKTGQTVLTASGQDHKGENLVSAYDLTRMLANVAWHPHLRPESRIPGLQQGAVDTLTRSLGTDSARFVDVSLEALGLRDRIENPVVLSKLGFGLSDQRNRWESVYSAFVSFTDKESGKTHQFALGLRGHHAPGGERPAVELDARMAAQVATVIQKVVTGELA